MKILYANKKVEKICSSFKEAKKFFGGDQLLATKLLGRIQDLKDANILQDFMKTNNARFHNLHDKGKNQYEGYFAIDVKTIRERWRLIIQPLDENENPFRPCHIDEIAKTVKIIQVLEVSDHYGM